MTGNSAVSETDKNIIISDVHRDFVARTGCNKNTVIFSLASGVTNGTLEYDKRSSDRLSGNDPTLTYFDYEGLPWYKLSNCDYVISIERFVTADDGANTIMEPVSHEDINKRGLLSGTTDYPAFYQMDGYNTFRMLRILATTAYTIKIRIVYMESVIDLVGNDSFPTDTTAPVFSGAGLNDMTINTVSTTGCGVYVVTVGTTGTPDKYTYTKNGVSGGAEANMAATVTLGTGGPVVAFATLTLHTTGNTWTFYQDDPQVGSIPLKYRRAVVLGAVAECFSVRGDERAMLYLQRYEIEVERCISEVHINTYDKPYVIRRRYKGAGG